MTAMQHLYLTAQGSYVTGPYVGEAAQVGFRFAFAPVASSPVMGETFEMQENGDAVPDFGTQAGSTGTLTKTWTARLGAPGSLENWGGVEQAAAGDLVHALVTALQPLQNVNFKWESVKQAPISTLGKTIGTASTFTFTTPVAGGSTAALPAQSALAISSRANIVGRSGRGRFYVPALTTQLLDSTGEVDSVKATNALTATKTFIDGMQGIIGGLSVQRSIYSITSAGKATAVRPVELRIGHLVDTIRSRRAQVEEEYATLAL